MLKSLLFQQQQALEENMSNLTSSASVEAAASVSSSQTQKAVKRKRNQPGNPDPDAEVIALSPKTLMTKNRFVCEICNKGFQRDQNLQLHRRGHNLPWKLKKRTSKEVMKKKVYVCPEANCVHHDPSRALGDLTGIKKHFFRKHGEKKWKCDKCYKKYAVQSDWKAHSKTCGTREYRCDCGTLFSRRDSFITHRAFCDALAEESARAFTGTSSSAANNPLFFTHLPSPPPSAEAEFNIPHQDIYLQASYSLKKECIPENILPPWLSSHAMLGAGPPQQPNMIFSSSSSRSDHHHHFTHDDHHQDFALPENPTLNPNPNPNLSTTVGPTLSTYHQLPVLSSHMSATALLQKAAQMGATNSSSSYNDKTDNCFGLNLSLRGHHGLLNNNNNIRGSSSTSSPAAGASSSSSPSFLHFC